MLWISCYLIVLLRVVITWVWLFVVVACGCSVGGLVVGFWLCLMFVFDCVVCLPLWWLVVFIAYLHVLLLLFWLVVGCLGCFVLLSWDFWFGVGYCFVLAAEYCCVSDLLWFGFICVICFCFDNLFVCIFVLLFCQLCELDALWVLCLGLGGCFGSCFARSRCLDWFSFEWLFCCVWFNSLICFKIVWVLVCLVYLFSSGYVGLLVLT